MSTTQQVTDEKPVKKKKTKTTKAQSPAPSAPEPAKSDGERPQQKEKQRIFVTEEVEEQYFRFAPRELKRGALSNMQPAHLVRFANNATGRVPISDRLMFGFICGQDWIGLQKCAFCGTEFMPMWAVIWKRILLMRAEDVDQGELAEFRKMELLATVEGARKIGLLMQGGRGIELTEPEMKYLSLVECYRVDGWKETPIVTGNFAPLAKVEDDKRKIVYEPLCGNPWWRNARTGLYEPNEEGCLNIAMKRMKARFPRLPIYAASSFTRKLSHERLRLTLLDRRQTAEKIERMIEDRTRLLDRGDNQRGGVSDRDLGRLRGGIGNK